MKRILIANRGEIALRIARACRQLNKQTVAVYTPVDVNLAHLDLVDDTVCIGHYLSADDIVMAALTHGCDAVHPGYGLLSENAEFATKVEAAGLLFIGPRADHIAELGDKISARRTFGELGLPSISGSQVAVKNLDEAKAAVAGIGYPILIKAALGGGGRGMRRVTSDAELTEQLQLAMTEAKAGFGDSAVFIEKELVNARHVEVQVLGDGSGGCIALGTRDCSIQRRYQKIIEECPAPSIEPAMINTLLETCVSAMSELRYRSAGTLEFLFSNDAFYFLEINTRIQVEHPVTEMVMDRDIVVSQIRIAEGEPLPEPGLGSGHALECRILAEDEFGKPGPGRITHLNWPGGPGVRVDSHLYEGYSVPHQYDSMIGKLIVHAETRTAAINKMLTALDETRIEGIPTNVKRLKFLVAHPEFGSMNIDINWNPK